MNNHPIEKPKNVDYFRMPRPLWRCIRRLLPKPKAQPQDGRPPADNRAVLNGIGYILWTGCQWKSVHKDWFGVCSTTLHERFQTWQPAGIFHKVMTRMVRFYARYRGIQWLFQAIDSKSCPAPLGGTDTGKSPVDRSKRGSKIHLLVDQRGAPLSVQISGANGHDKWLADDLIISIVVPRPKADEVEQHICMDKGYDYTDVHQFVELERYVVHIKHRRRRGEPMLRHVPYLAKRNIRYAAGWSNAPSVGWRNAAVCACAGAKKRTIGWRLFNSPALTFSWI